MITECVNAATIRLHSISRATSETVLRHITRCVLSECPGTLHELDPKAIRIDHVYGSSTRVGTGCWRHRLGNKIDAPGSQFRKERIQVVNHERNVSGPRVPCAGIHRCAFDVAVLKQLKEYI